MRCRLTKPISHGEIIPGANTLGNPIISGIVNGNIAFTLQGAVLIGLLAVTVDSAFSRIA